MDVQQLAARVAELRNEIRKSERAIEKWKDIEAQAEKSVTHGGYLILIGILLVPALGLGLLMVAFGFFLRMSNFGKRKKAQKAIEANRNRIETLEDQLQSLEGQLLAMQAGVQPQQG